MTTATLNGADLKAARAKLAQIKKKTEALREQEIEIRQYIADVIFPEESGSKTFTIEGVKLTVARPLNLSISAADAERLVRDHPDLSVEVLRWKPEVRSGPFKEHVEVLADFIVSKPGLPTVTFK